MAGRTTRAGNDRARTGELWLDTRTYMPIRESGRLVKNPSVFLKKVEFVRDYVVENGISIPKHIKSKVETRIVGTADISIEYTNLQKLQEQTPAEVNAAQQPASASAAAIEQARLGR